MDRLIGNEVRSGGAVERWRHLLFSESMRKRFEMFDVREKAGIHNYYTIVRKRRPTSTIVTWLGPSPVKLDGKDPHGLCQSRQTEERQLTGGQQHDCETEGGFVTSKKRLLETKTIL